jgi:hypothetical protein
MSNLKQFTGRRTPASEHLIRGLSSGTAQVRGHNPDGTPRVYWMPGFIPLEYIRATNRDRLGVTAEDPVFASGAPLGREALA